jgi:hypothetical protein
MQAEVTNDFLEYLLKTMFSGMGIPPEYLSYSEQTEFARSLGMMNGKFVRTIITYQKIFAEQFTELFQKLYTNEYLNDYTLKEKKKLFNKLNKSSNDETIDSNEERKKLAKNEIISKEMFDVSIITVQFPSPQALNMTATVEQANATKDMVEFITSTLVPEDDSELTSVFKRKVTQELNPSFDWVKWNKLLNDCKIQKTQEALDKAASADDEGSSDGGY